MIYLCHTTAALNPDPSLTSTVEVWVYRATELPQVRIKLLQ